jgi:hypothetical protein
MRFLLCSVSVLLAFSSVVGGCSSDEGAKAAPGTVALEGVTSTHQATVLRFTATVHNTMAKGIKSLDTIELDAGDGPKRATSIAQCDAPDVAPWLVKAGASSAVQFTLRSNGPERMVVEAFCFADGKQTNRSALWEFETSVKVATNGADPLKITMTGDLDDGSIWSASATSTRQ